MEVVEFVRKWSDAPSKPNFFDDTGFIDDCRSLGFEMDCGRSLVEATSSEEAAYEPGAFEHTASSVDDPAIIGSATFSQWRYVSHWACGAPSADVLRWFELAFERLAELSMRSLP